jgi:hypothetical protein
MSKLAEQKTGREKLRARDFKKILLLLPLLFAPSLAFAECRNEPKFFPKINTYLDRLVGDADCVMADAMQDDLMIAGYWIEDKSTTMFIAINNIRAGRDIDIDFYGYNDGYKTSMLEKIENVSSIKFVKRFSYNGATQPQIEMRLNEGGFKR